MRFVLFYHSFASCWNHGNAHFLRGVARELIALGHQVHVYEPENGWSRMNAMRDGGAAALREAAALVPGIVLTLYDPERLDLEAALDGAEVVIVHEWNPPELVARIGRHRARGGPYTLFFHDTHHRAISVPEDMRQYRLDDYDAVLAFGETLRETYLRNGWGARVFTWHEAADTALFRPLPGRTKDTGLIWIGNWGDEERSAELHEFLIEPIGRAKLAGRIHGVRYPETVRRTLAERGIHFAGWLPNHRAPDAFATAQVTVHVPRRHYVKALPGIPTIRVFEALACGIPLVCAPWDDAEELFPRGAYLSAHDGKEMTQALTAIACDTDLRHALIKTGLFAIRERHTCAHRVAELMGLITLLRGTRDATDTSVVAQRQWVA
jgi:spore maturation protein CgeB